MTIAASASMSTTCQASPERRHLRPVLVWAGFGAACTAMAATVYLRWLSAGPVDVDPGPDAVPAATRAMAIGFQVVSPILAVVALAFVIRQSVRARRLTLDAMIVIAWAVAWWHDQTINLIQPGVLYNAVLVDLGSPMPHVPGWLAGQSDSLPEPILMIGTVYVWLGLAFAMLATTVMRRAQRRWPRLGVVGTIAAAYAVVASAEMALEVLVIRTELVAYPSTIAELTLFAGDPRQVPLYPPLLWSAALTATGALRYFVDEQGRSVVERGVDRVRAGLGGRAVLSAFAVIGFVHATAFAYDAVVNATMLWADSTEAYPTYLRGDACGPGTGVECDATAP